MPKTMTAEEKLDYMTHSPISKLLFKLAVPSIVSMLISSFYNMADTYFVGQIGSASATGAIGVVFPLMAIMQAIGFMFGHGSGNHMARVLGAGDTEDASRMAATGFISSFIAGVAVALLALVLINPLVYWLGATDTIAPYARSYVGFLLPGIPFLISSLVLNNQLRYQGSAFYSMIGITSGAVLNMLLDPLFIFVFDMGVAGAALATSISQCLSFLLLLKGTRRGGNIRIQLKSFTPTRDNYREILRGGVPSLARQGLASLATICLNVAAGGYGDAAIAAMSIVTRVIQMGGSAVIGIGQGFQPICGFNYGAKLYGRVRNAFWFCIKSSTCILVVVSALAIVFAPNLIALFQRNDARVIEIGTLALRLQCMFFPIFSFVSTSNMMLQTMGMAGKATLLAVSRQGICFIPAVLILERCFGLLGVQLAQPTADLMAFMIALPISLGVLKELKQKEAARVLADGEKQ